MWLNNFSVACSLQTTSVRRGGPSISGPNCRTSRGRSVSTTDGREPAALCPPTKTKSKSAMSHLTVFEFITNTFAGTIMKICCLYTSVQYQGIEGHVAFFFTCLLNCLINSSDSFMKNNFKEQLNVSDLVSLLKLVRCFLLHYFAAVVVILL